DERHAGLGESIDARIDANVAAANETDGPNVDQRDPASPGNTRERTIRRSLEAKCSVVADDGANRQPTESVGNVRRQATQQNRKLLNRHAKNVARNDVD